MTQKCPVCGKDLKETYRDCIEGALCELTEECPDGCYSYDFAYGGTTVVIDGEEVYGHYTDYPDQFHARLERQKALVASAKKKRGLA
jgi:hypothetical protein